MWTWRRARIDMEHMQSLISPRTRLVAVGYASNAVGTINDVATVIDWAKAAGAYTLSTPCSMRRTGWSTSRG